MHEQPNIEKPDLSKYTKGQFSLTPEEIEKAKKQGDLPKQQQKMREATEAVQKEGVVEITPEEEEKSEQEMKAALREIDKKFRKDLPKS
ncbi:MAG: hypothetical protein V1845_01240 [bacterium]